MSETKNVQYIGEFKNEESTRFVNCSMELVDEYVAEVKRGGKGRLSSVVGLQSGMKFYNSKCFMA